MDPLRNIFSKFVSQLLEKFVTTQIDLRVKSWNHGVINLFKKFAEFGEYDVDSRSQLRAFIEIWIGIGKSVKGSHNGINRCLLKATSVIDHNALIDA